MSEKHGPCILSTSSACFNRLRHCPIIFSVKRVFVLNVLQKSPLNHLGNLDALPEVIAEETSTSVAQCYGAKNSVDMAEIKFVCLTKSLL